MIEQIERSLINEEDRIYPATNVTAIDTIINKLRNFTVPELTGMTLGAGTILILLFCAAGCLAWCCGIRRCPAHPGESFSRSPSPTPPPARVRDHDQEPTAAQAAASLGSRADAGPLLDEQRSSPLEHSLQRFSNHVLSLSRLSKNP